MILTEAKLIVTYIEKGFITLATEWPSLAWYKKALRNHPVRNNLERKNPETRKNPKQKHKSRT